MAPSNVDRNLLFGILALQLDFVTRDQLVAAMRAWVADKSEPIGQWLRRQGALEQEPAALLEALVDMHLARHDNDAQKSLAAIGSARSAPEQITQLADPQLGAPPSHLHTPPGGQTADPHP